MEIDRILTIAVVVGLGYYYYNQYKKYRRCVHCQTKNSLVLLKPCVKRSKLYNFVMFCLKKIGCYT